MVGVQSRVPVSLTKRQHTSLDRADARCVVIGFSRVHKGPVLQDEHGRLVVIKRDGKRAQLDLPVSS